MKRKNYLFVVLVVALFFVFAVASGEDSSTTVNQGVDSAASSNAEDDSALGDYSVEISSSRLVKDFEGNDVIIVKYIFTNVNGDNPTSFVAAFDDQAYQNGVGLNESYFLSDDAEYSLDNQTKEIKKGASLEVEVAYELNDTTTDVEVEIEELFSFEEKTITKTFEIAE
ncbi:MAG: DUF5067 domain-containing protein [Acutalibacteraceae bacterium]